MDSINLFIFHFISRSMGFNVVIFTALGIRDYYRLQMLEYDLISLWTFINVPTYHVAICTIIKEKRGNLIFRSISHNNICGHGRSLRASACQLTAGLMSKRSDQWNVPDINCLYWDTISPLKYLKFPSCWIFISIETSSTDFHCKTIVD